MNLYISDKVLERMIDLPKETSKKIIEFQKKFRTNSRTEAIDLESIHEFKDKKLRTARIDQKYRAVIAVSETGENYYLLWVDNHDEAVKWGRDKFFEWNNVTGAPQIFTVPEVQAKEARPQIEGTKGTKGLYSGYTDKQLKQIGVPSPLMHLVRSIQDLDDLGALEKDFPVDCFENLFMLADGVDIESVIDEVKHGKEVKEGETLSDNQKRFFVEASDEILKDAINGDFEKWQVFLHPSQRRLVDQSFRGTMRVTGGAGTGKTVVALHRLKHLSEKYKGGKSRRILFTTFTNALTQHLENLAKRIGVDMSKVLLTNIDSIARELALTYGLTTARTRIMDVGAMDRSIDAWKHALMGTVSTFDAPFMQKEYQEVILYHNIGSRTDYLITARTGRSQALSRVERNKVWDLVEGYEAYKKKKGLVDRGELFNRVRNHLVSTGVKPFEHIVADELQDLSNIELRFLRSLAEAGPDDLFLVGDPYQKIYVRKISFSKAGISVTGTRSRQLKINYRTSEEIRRAAVTTVKDIPFDDFDGTQESLNGYMSLFHGEKPTYKVYSRKSDEVEAVLKDISAIHDSGIPYKAMTVGVRVRASINSFRDALHKQGIPYYDNIDGKHKDITGVRLSTLHGLKGLEFKAVFLVDVHKGNCPLIIQDFESLGELERREHLESERSLMYVAMSRAVSRLTISGTGVASEMVRL